MAPDFVVEGAHRLTLQVEIEIHVEFASLAEIAPDCRRRRWLARRRRRHADGSLLVETAHRELEILAARQGEQGARSREGSQTRPDQVRWFRHCPPSRAFPVWARSPQAPSTWS